MTTLRQLVADVEKVWSPPAGRAWSLADVRIRRLLARAGTYDDRIAVLEKGIRDALDGLDRDGAPAEILRTALGAS